MTDNLLTPIIILIVIAAITTTVLTRFRRGSFALGFGSSYSLFMLLWWLIERNAQVDSANIWSLIIPLMMAAPTSFLLPYISGPTFTEKCVGLALLGSIQYGAAGFLIDLAVYKWKKKKESANNAPGTYFRKSNTTP